jgi:DNA anti-recombination protein RmuC
VVIDSAAEPSVSSELVNWLNAVDADYRGQLREFNELNFARFDAKLEQRAAALDAKIEQRAAALNAKIEKLGTELRAEMKAGLAELRTEMMAGLAELRTEMAKGFEKLGSGLLKWLFGFWASVVLALVLLAFRVN